MKIKVFVLGRPGSGKSTAARHLNHYFTKQGCSTMHINDYSILRQMFLEDVEHKKFQPTANNGFDAIDLSVLDTALYEVERVVEEWLPFTNVVTIEFARDNYSHAFRQFSPHFLRDAYVLFLDADLETCLERVHARVERSKGADDHPSFSNSIFRSYYAHDNKPYITSTLQQEFKMNKHAQLINNTGSLENCISMINQFAEDIIENEVDQRPISVLAC